MTVWEDVQTALQNFWNWLTSTTGSVSAQFTDTLGELGSWLFGGLKWLADQIYNAWTYFSRWLYSGLTWLGDRLKEGYEAIAQWISSGLQWIGSGLSWIGQQLYSFGQWLWSGIVWTARTVANVIEGFINWVWERLVGAYNSIVSYLASWVKGINDFLNDWIKALRQKFTNVVIVNTTLPALFKSFDMFIEGKYKEGIIGIFTSPFVGAITGYMADIVIPRPHSERIMFFPEFLFPTLTYTPITIEKPEMPTVPPTTEIPTTPMYPPSVGYRPIVEKANIAYTSYDIIVQGVRLGEKLCKAVTEYSIELSEVLISELTNKAITEYDLITALFETRELVSKAVDEVETILRAGTFITKTNFAGTTYDILVSSISGLHKYNYTRTLYDAYISTITKLSGVSKAGTEVVLLPSIGVAITTTPSTQVVVETYMPQELPQYQEGTGTSYEIEVIHPSSSIAYTSKVGTSYEIGGTVVVAMVEAVIYLGTTEYKKVETTNPFSEDFVIQGRLVVKYEPEEAMFEDWYISAGSSGEQSGGTTYIYARATNNVGTSYNVELT